MNIEPIPYFLYMNINKSILQVCVDQATKVASTTRKMDTFVAHQPTKWPIQRLLSII